MIIDEINKKIIDDYKSGNADRRILLQTLKASLINRQKDLKDAYSEQEEIKVLKNELKQRQEALEQFKSASRKDLVEKNQKEIDLISEMLPEQMSEVEIEKIITVKISTAQDKSFGTIMKEVMQDLKGKADGKIVSDLVRKHLSSLK